MPVNKYAREKGARRPISVRISSAQREILRVFAAADGHEVLTPVLQEALAFYIHTRLRHGRESVRVEVPVQVGQ